VDSARYDVVVRLGAGGKPNLVFRAVNLCFSITLFLTDIFFFTKVCFGYEMC
jgi:hypothetical protein